MKPLLKIVSGLLIFSFLITACGKGAGTSPEAAGLKVLAVETFLADITQNVAGERLKVDALIPAGLDPHAFEPTPQDLARISSSQVLIANGSGLEAWLEKILQNAGGERRVIEASAGLPPRPPDSGEAVRNQPGEGDPHFWLDPNLATTYVENIRDGLIAADPQGRETYTQNAETYIARLKELDAWVREQVAAIPPERRILVTNHEELGYFADRYGFTIAGAILPSPSSTASPSAQGLAHLVETIQKTGAPAIFLETGANPQMAESIARETGVKVVTGLYTHSISPPGGEAPAYIDMIKFDTNKIVEALK